MKKCVKCGQEKPYGLFTKDKRLLNGVRKVCKECHTKYMTDYYNNNPEKKKLKNEMNTFYRPAWKRHGLSESQHEALLKKENGKCHACKIQDAVYIDHDHSCCNKNFSCGKCVRGIVCHNCNSALGHMKDNPEVAKSIYTYMVSTNLA